MFYGKVLVLSALYAATIYTNYIIEVCMVNKSYNH